MTGCSRDAIGYDAMKRPASLPQAGVGTLVSGVGYNGPSGELSQLSYEGWTETRYFNVTGQFTRITVTKGTGPGHSLAIDPATNRS